MVSSLLSVDDARAVEAAVEAIERKTSAEVVVAVVPQSYEYWQGRVLLAVAWALAGGFAFLHFEPWREPALALLVELVVGALSFAISGYKPLRRRLASEKVAKQAAQARAFQLFAERGLHGTRSRTALLIFVSELEHSVVLLGDQTIHAELGQAGWDEYVQLLVQHLRKGEARAGILEVLARLEPHLVRVAPPLPGDVNELPDAVLRA